MNELLNGRGNVKWRLMRRGGVGTLWIAAATLALGLGLPDLSTAQTDSTTSQASAAALKLTLTGFLFGQLVIDANRTLRDPSLNIQPLPGIIGVPDTDPDAFFDVRATRVGLELGAVTGDELEVAAQLEIDFDTRTGAPRIRHAAGELSLGSWQILGGQTWAIVSQLNPMTINNDNLFNIGNTYERVPQARVSYRKDSGHGWLDLEIGAGTFFGQFDQLLLAIRTDPAAPEPMIIENNTPPVLQGRLAYGWHNAGRRAHMALGGSVGRVDARSPSGLTDDVAHVLVVAEVLFPVVESFEIMAEAFYGEAPGFNGGIGQTAVVTASGDLVPVKSWGGFVQLEYLPVPDLTLNVMAGIDDPQNSPGGTPLTLERNWTALGNAFWQIADRFTSAIELQYLRSEYEAARETADNLRTTFAIFVRI